MENSSIPRKELETFATESYKIPLFDVQHYPVDSSYFIIQNRETYPVKDYISPHRRKFYKIFHMTSGTGILTVGLHQYEMGRNEIGFLHPDEIVSWQTTSKETGGHFCLIHPDFFGRDAEHVLQWLKQFPYFLPDKAVVQLQEDQSAAINGYFATMLREAQSDSDDSKQAIMLQLQLLLLESQRAGKNRIQTEVQENYGHIYKFLSLLESSFQVRDRNALTKLKTAAEFADEPIKKTLY